MEILRSLRYALPAWASALMLAGCAGAGIQPAGGLATAGQPSTRPAARSNERGTQAVHPDRGHSWMLPSAKTDELLYVSDDATNDVFAYSYRKRTLEGTLTGFDQPEGLCVDKHGDVFVTSNYGQDILEYAHGGTTPIATLSDTNEYPVGCSIDPTTGNLAVANIFGGSQLGNVAIYVGAQGTPTTYADPTIGFLDFDGYDNAGNIFVDGSNSGGSGFEFAELKKGSSSFTSISLDVSIGYPGNIQWDGKHITVGDQISNTIYRIDVAGSEGTSIGSTSLTGAYDVDQYWIRGRTVIGPDADNADVGYWRYPAGGEAKKDITGIGEPYGATVSKGAK